MWGWITLYHSPEVVRRLSKAEAGTKIGSSLLALFGVRCLSGGIVIPFTLFLGDGLLCSGLIGLCTGLLDVVGLLGEVDIAASWFRVFSSESTLQHAQSTLQRRRCCL